MARRRTIFANFSTYFLSPRYRRKVHQVLESAITRRTLCAVVVDVRLTTSRNPSALNAATQPPRSDHVSIKRFGESRQEIGEQKMLPHWLDW